MDDELKGRNFNRYSLAYRMSRVRDWLGEQQERLMP